jgi:photosystem II stability/assembly factor-like uncharacterized protein
MTVIVVCALVCGAQIPVGANGAVAALAPTCLPGAESAAGPGPVAAGFTWQLQANPANAVFIDIAMADDSVGFAAAELGVVYRTTDAGANWTRVMNLGFPYYWYGVAAPSREDVLVSGFNNTTGAGICRWSHDGGANWDPVVDLDTANWLSRARFADSLHGIISAGWNGGVWRTENGGRNAGDWNYVQVDPSRGWFEGNFCYRPDGRCWLTGISLCNSTDDGQTWDVQHSADPVFDGGVWFTDSLRGWTGGGQISSPVSGWVHRTTDGGATWTGRILETPAPVRAVLFLDDSLGFAVGGNIYSNAGFIYSTTDGGDSWVLDLDTGSEMKGIDFKAVGDSVDVWCCGFNRNFTGCIYRTRIRRQVTGVEEHRTQGVARTTSGGSIVRGVLRLPGLGTRSELPGNGRDVPASRAVMSRAALLDAAGRRVMSLRPGPNDVSRLAPGVYFVRAAGQCRRVVIVRGVAG